MASEANDSCKPEGTAKTLNTTESWSSRQSHDLNGKSLKYPNFFAFGSYHARLRLLISSLSVQGSYLVGLRGPTI